MSLYIFTRCLYFDPQTHSMETYKNNTSSSYTYLAKPCTKISNKIYAVAICPAAGKGLKKTKWYLEIRPCRRLSMKTFCDLWGQKRTKDANDKARIQALTITLFYDIAYSALLFMFAQISYKILWWNLSFTLN